MALALFVDRATTLTRTGLRRCRQEPATDAARVLACLGRRSRRLQSTTGGGRTSRRLQSTAGGRTSRRLRQILRQGGLCAATKDTVRLPILARHGAMQYTYIQDHLIHH